MIAGGWSKEDMWKGSDRLSGVLHAKMEISSFGFLFQSLELATGLSLSVIALNHENSG
jgi:hypothetical protein